MGLLGHLAGKAAKFVVEQAVTDAAALVENKIETDVHTKYAGRNSYVAVSAYRERVEKYLFKYLEASVSFKHNNSKLLMNDIYGIQFFSRNEDWEYTCDLMGGEYVLTDALYKRLGKITIDESKNSSEKFSEDECICSLNLFQNESNIGSLYAYKILDKKEYYLIFNKTDGTQSRIDLKSNWSFEDCFYVKYAYASKEKVAYVEYDDNIKENIDYYLLICCAIFIAKDKI